MSDKPRKYTEDEVRDKFLGLVREYINYWADLDGRTEREKLEGLAFSILVILDGESVELPAFSVSPLPHKTDKAFHKKNGESWFPRKGCDIAGDLHHQLKRVKP